MKRILLALMLLSLMLLCTMAFADTVTIGTGTTTTSYLPIYGSYGYNYTQQIYTQTQINTAGNITKIRFFYVSGAIANSKDWVIYMGHTTKTTFSTTTDWEPLANLTQVFAGDVTNYLPAANNWMEIPLDDPFPYNNTDNLLIAVDENTPGYATMSWGGFTSGTNTGIYYYNDTTNPNPASPPTATSRTATIDRIQLVFPNSSAPLAPTLVTPVDGGWFVDGDRLTWTTTQGGGDVNAFDVYFGTSDDPPLVSEDQVGSFYIPTVSAGQTYHWKVVAKNELGISPASEVRSFRTPGPNNLVESFEPTTFPPPGWANTGTWSRSTSYKVNGLASAYKYGATSTQYILSMPKLTITGDSSLNFWAYCTSTTGTLQVVYSEDRVTWTQVGANITYPAASTWYNHNIDLSSLAGNNYYLGLRTGLQAVSHYVDMVIGPEITPEAPGAPTLSAPAASAVNQGVYPTFTWTMPTIGGAPTHYNIYCDTNPTPSTMIGTSTTLSFVPAEALDWETTYYWTVKAANSMGEGPAAAARSFTTMADPTVYSFPWSEDFEGTTFPPANWTRLTGLYPSETPATYAGGWSSANFANVATPPNKSARLNIYETTVKYWLVTPPIAIPAAGYEVKFDLALTTFSGSNPVDPTQQLDDKFIVLIADNPMMAGATVLRQWDNAGSPYVYNNIVTLGELQTIDLSAYTGTKYIAFYGESTVTGGDNNVYVDNVTVREIPASAIFAYSPDSIDFGVVFQNVPTAWQNVTILNNGGGTLSLRENDVSIIGPHQGMFELDDSNLPAELGAGESVQIPVHATVTTEGPVTATLRMAYAGVNYDVSLSASGLPAGTVVIGDGNANQNIPIHPYWGYNYSQSVYLQSEINIADQRIEKIAYYWTGAVAGTNVKDWKIYMGHTTRQVFQSTTDWVPFGELTEVFNGEVIFPAVAGWVEIMLTNPFIYDNVQNLVIAVDENTPGNNGNVVYFHSTLTPDQNRSLLYYSDSINPDPVNPPISGNYLYLKAAYPNIMMIFGDLPTVPIFSYAPNSLDFGTITQNNPTAWQNVTVANTGAGTLSLRDTDISIFGTHAGMFEFDDVNLPFELESGASGVIPVRVTATAEGPLTATLRMVYDGVNYDVALSANGLPAGTVIIGDGITTQAKPFGTTWGYERSAGLYTAEQIGLIGAVDNVGWYCNTTSATSIPYKIYVGSTANAALTAQSWDNLKAGLTLVKEGTHVFSTQGWHNFELDTPVIYSGGNLIVAVETNYGGSGGGSGHLFRYTVGAAGSHIYWNVDTTPPTTANGTLNTSRPNLMLHIEPPIEGAPAAPIMIYPEHNATGLPANGFNLSWSADLENGGVPDYYAVYLSQDEDTIFDDYYFETENTFFNPVTEGGITLGYEQTWYWLVQAFNAYDDAIAERIYSFVTETDPRITSLPHSQNFDGVTTPNMPRAWTAVKTYTSSSLVTSSTYSHTPSNSVYMYNYTTTETMRLVTPEITVPINSIRLNFQLRATSIANYSMKIGTVSSPDASGIFTEVATIVPTVSAAFEEHSVSFANYTGTDRYICIQHGVGATYQSFYLDTILFEELMPVDMAATAIAGPGFGIAGTPFDYEISVKNNGTASVNAYNVYLKLADHSTAATLAVNAPLDPDQTAVHQLSWTPPLDGNYTVYGQVVAAGDGNATNDITATKDIIVFEDTMTQFPVGDDETNLSNYYLPFGFYHKNSISEALYFSDELHLESGSINSVIFKNTFTSLTVLNKPVKIWMANTDLVNLTGGWIPASSYTLVFDGNVDFPSGVNFIVIPLDTPFAYTGSNLAVRFNRPLDTQYYLSTDKFFYTLTDEHQNRGRYLASDTVEYNPLDPAASGTGTAVHYVPNTTFIVQNAVLQPHAKLHGYVRDVANNPIVDATVTLTDERYSTITDADGYYSFIFWEAHPTVSVNASKHGYYSQSVDDIELIPGTPVTQDFVLTAMPRVPVLGSVYGNDGLAIEGAKVVLNGIENYQVFTNANGLFTIPNVLGSNMGVDYTITVTATGYNGYSGTVTAYMDDVELDPITLVEKLWPATALVATHDVGNVVLNWEEAAEPSYLFWDFEDDDGGWVSGGYGDWEWGNTYPAGGTFNWTEYLDSCIPPAAAHSGTGLWGTKLYTNYSNSGTWSYLTKTVNLAGIENPQLRFWRWNNLYGDFDYYQVQVNGTMVFEEKVTNNAWAEKVVNLSAYAEQEITIRFAVWATTVVAYAGLYIDDVYIGPPPAPAGRFAQGRSLQGYKVYRMLAADQANEANWTLLNGNVTGLTFTDDTFSSAPGGKYKWAVKAVYTGSHLANAVISNPLGRVYTPQNIVAQKVGANIQLSWTPEPGASFYRVYAADTPDGPWGEPVTTSNTTYNPSASNGKKFFRVSAVADETAGRTAGE